MKNQDPTKAYGRDSHDLQDSYKHMLTRTECNSYLSWAWLFVRLCDPAGRSCPITWELETHFVNMIVFDISGSERCQLVERWETNIWPPFKHLLQPQGRQWMVYCTSCVDSLCSMACVLLWTMPRIRLLLLKHPHRFALAWTFTAGGEDMAHRRSWQPDTSICCLAIRVKCSIVDEHNHPAVFDGLHVKLLSLNIFLLEGVSLCLPGGVAGSQVTV